MSAQNNSDDDEDKRSDEEKIIDYFLNLIDTQSDYTFLNTEMIWKNRILPIGTFYKEFNRKLLLPDVHLQYFTWVKSLFKGSLFYIPPRNRPDQEKGPFSMFSLRYCNQNEYLKKLFASINTILCNVSNIILLQNPYILYNPKEYNGITKVEDNRINAIEYDFKSDLDARPHNDDILYTYQKNTSARANQIDNATLNDNNSNTDNIQNNDDSNDDDSSSIDAVVNNDDPINIYKQFYEEINNDNFADIYEYEFKDPKELNAGYINSNSDLLKWLDKDENKNNDGSYKQDMVKRGLLWYYGRIRIKIIKFIKKFLKCKYWYNVKIPLIDFENNHVKTYEYFPDDQVAYFFALAILETVSNLYMMFHVVTHMIDNFILKVFDDDHLRVTYKLEDAVQDSTEAFHPDFLGLPNDTNNNNNVRLNNYIERIQHAIKNADPNISDNLINTDKNAYQIPFKISKIDIDDVNKPVKGLLPDNYDKKSKYKAETDQFFNDVFKPFDYYLNKKRNNVVNQQPAIVNQPPPSAQPIPPSNNTSQQKGGMVLRNPNFNQNDRNMMQNHNINQSQKLMNTIQQRQGSGTQGIAGHSYGAGVNGIIGHNYGGKKRKDRSSNIYGAFKRNKK